MTADWTREVEAAARAQERAAEWMQLLPGICAVGAFLFTLAALLALRRH